MMKKWLALPLFAGLVGCATLEPLDNELSMLKGQNIETAYAILGYPTGKLELDSVTVYYWKNTSRELYPYFSTSDTTGYIGRRRFNGISTSTEWGQATFECEIKLGVVDKKIENYQYIGSVEGCRPYLQRINTYMQN